MAYTPHPTVATGQTWSAANQNTYVKDNLDALFPYTAALQVAYSTSTNSLSKATASAALMVLRCNAAGTAIEFGSVPTVYKRQGTSSTLNWYSSAASTALTDHTPSSPKIQLGQTFSTSTGSITVTFPTAFLGTPLVIAQFHRITAVTTSNFTFTTTSTAGVTTSISWLAFGDI